MPASGESRPGKSIPKSSRNTLFGSTAYERENRYNVNYGGEPESSAQALTRAKTEFDILKENHRFIRDDEEPGNVTWEERVARAYESKLFKEYALIDLKHYKSSRFALRWRSAEEVVRGSGETTCSSLRCPYHALTDQDLLDGLRIPPLRAFELPFAYEEAGERKSALVKVKLCGGCERKLLWKHRDRGESVLQRDPEEYGANRNDVMIESERGGGRVKSGVMETGPNDGGHSRRRSRDRDRHRSRSPTQRRERHDRR